MQRFTNELNITLSVLALAVGAIAIGALSTELLRPAIGQAGSIFVSFFSGLTWGGIVGINLFRVWKF